MKTVLFACVHNAGRSQMAAAWFNALADRGKARGISAGTQPGDRVHPEVLAAMGEVGIDLNDARPRLLTDDLAGGATLLITMGCGEACPVVPGLRREDWPLDDPRGKPIERVREIRDDVRRRVEALVARERVAAAPAPEAPTAADLPVVVALLEAARLPTAGVADHFPHAYAVIRPRAGVIAVAGLERYGDAGLLRSVAVEVGARGRGLGRALVHDRIEAGRRSGLAAIYLLTTTAPEFFRALGFSNIDRSLAPDSVRAAPEFRTICPASATCLTLRLR